MTCTSGWSVNQPALAPHARRYLTDEAVCKAYQATIALGHVDSDSKRKDVSDLFSYYCRQVAGEMTTHIFSRLSAASNPGTAIGHHDHVTRIIHGSAATADRSTAASPAAQLDAPAAAAAAQGPQSPAPAAAAAAVANGDSRGDSTPTPDKGSAAVPQEAASAGAEPPPAGGQPDFVNDLLADGTVDGAMACCAEVRARSLPSDEPNSTFV